MNVLNLKKYHIVDYNLGMMGNPINSIQGKLTCICNEYFNGVLIDDIWDRIGQFNGNNDSIVYIITVTRGSEQLTYVGKTLNTFARRYPQGAKGGLKKVFDLYAKGDATLDCVLYNASHPALVELWCYQILVDRGIKLANRQDPS